MILLLFGLTLAGLATLLVARAIAMPRARVAEALSQIEAYGYDAPVATVAGLDAPVVASDSLRTSVDRAAAVVGAFLAARFDSIKENDLRRTLVGAGMYRTSPRTFVGYQTAAAVGLGLFGLWYMSSRGQPFIYTLAALAVGVLLGFRLPRILVQQRAKRRMNQIERDLPDLIDILIVTIEAGVAFIASLQLAADRLSGPLGDELRLTLQEQRMGLGTSEALRNLLSRCETPGVLAFVRSMLQGEQLGVSVGQIMRDLARDMRLRRRQMAEERAQKAPIKILFPLVFLIFPAMFIVILYPAIRTILDTL